MDSLHISVYSLEGSDHPYQDRWLVHPSGDSVRTAVIDGVTPWRSEPVPGSDAAQYAASTLMRDLALPLSLPEAFRQANRELHSAALKPARRQSAAAAAAVDVREQRGILDCSGIVAGDCEWWVANDRSAEMRLLVGGTMWAPAALREMERLNSTDPISPQTEAGGERLRQREADVFDAPNTFLRHAVGRFPDPHFSLAGGKFTSVLLASDGVRLLEAPAVRADSDFLSEWLSHISGETKRDDITVMLIQPA